MLSQIIVLQKDTKSPYVHVLRLDTDTNELLDSVKNIPREAFDLLEIKDQGNLWKEVSNWRDQRTYKMFDWDFELKKAITS